MIKYEVILEAKLGNEKAINEILEFYLSKIKKVCDDDDFIQMAWIRVFRAKNNFKNIKK